MNDCRFDSRLPAVLLFLWSRASDLVWKSCCGEDAQKQWTTQTAHCLHSSMVQAELTTPKVAFKSWFVSRASTSSFCATDDQPSRSFIRSQRGINGSIRCEGRCASWNT